MLNLYDSTLDARSYMKDAKDTCPPEANEAPA